MSDWMQQPAMPDTMASTQTDELGSCSCAAINPPEEMRETMSEYSIDDMVAICANRGSYNDYATAASQQEILFGQQFQNLDNKADRLGNGIADAAFALNNSIGAVGTKVLESKYENAMRIDQLARDMAHDRCELTKTIMHGNFELSKQMDAMEHRLTVQEYERRLAEQAARISSLELNDALSGVVRFPSSYTYDAGHFPHCK